MANGKKNILIIMGRYLPGYKDGGPVRSIKNLVDYLGDEYNFMILTCDRDHGDIEPYPNIKVNDWNEIGKAKVYYVPPKGFKFSIIKKLSKQVDIIYCCGCFNDYAINTLLLNRIGLIKPPLVVASMGLFSPLEFSLKYKKKKIFTTVFNKLGMFKDIYWSATSEIEINHIKQQIKTNNNFFIAEDLPRKIYSANIFKKKESGELKVVWISRIAHKKNLKGAIKIIKKLKCNVEFSIYGPKHIQEYWNECESELRTLPNNIRWSWKGSVETEEVVNVLKQHHVFLFPTFGENYGHVIQEALSAGCPVILSDQTPWQDLEKNGAGYVFPIDDDEKFVLALEKYAYMGDIEFKSHVDKALNYIITNNKDKVKNTGYRDIFK
ncbi:glycosyltransferase family 4 protein [Paraclostridium sordellii]|uniref:glycosyltransferase family 4 protein n=1 Tax=Paraclostridium sordellii TaxID=1505 RepID=UPI00189A1CD6|nr:glycosyltransferase family 4 protein [Paeniclostridium sordellii]